jgi:hypothetical protein
VILFLDAELVLVARGKDPHETLGMFGPSQDQPRMVDRLGQAAIWRSIGSEKFVPEEMDHGEITIRMSMMNEVQFLFASEPTKPFKPRSLDVILLVKEYVDVE